MPNDLIVIPNKVMRERRNPRVWAPLVSDRGAQLTTCGSNDFQVVNDNQDELFHYTIMLGTSSGRVEWISIPRNLTHQTTHG